MKTFIYQSTVSVLCVLCFAACQNITNPEEPVNPTDTTASHMRPVSCPDSIVTYMVQLPSNEEKLIGTCYFQYDKNRNLILETNGNQKWEYAYDAHGNQIRKIEYYFYSSQQTGRPDEWGEFSYSTYTYDDNNRLEQYAYCGLPNADGMRDTIYLVNVSWKDDRHSWSEQYKQMKSKWFLLFGWDNYFTATGKIEKENFYTFPTDSTWGELYCYEWSYDEHDNPVLTYTKMDGEIKYGSRTEYTYDADGYILVAYEKSIGEGGVENESSVKKHVYYY